MAKTNSEINQAEEKDTEFFKFIANHWGKISTIIGAIVAIFYTGYTIGVKITTIEFETQKNTILNEKNKEIMDIREKYMDEKFNKMESINSKVVESKGGQNEK